jgi:hypothetical protein
MKFRLFVYMLLVLAPAGVAAQIHLNANDLVTLSGYGLDSAGIQQTPDSVRVVVTHEGLETHDAWYEASDAQCASLNGGLAFYDAIGDLDNDAGPGLYEIRAGFFLEHDSLYNWRTLWVYLGVDLAAIEDTVQGIKDILDDRELWSLAGRAPIGDTSHGSSSGPDSATLARAVWNAPVANHTIAGTFGDYLDAEVSGIGTGGGAYSVSIVAVDTLTGQTVPGVRVAVRNLEQTGLLAVGATDPSGTVRFNLDVGQFLLTADAPGYLFTPFDSLLVAGPVTDSVRGRRFDPGDPGSPTLCRVYGFVYGVGGSPEAGAVVSAGLPKGISRTDELIISPSAVTAITDSTGYFQLDLIPSASLDSSPKYELTVTRADGAILRKRLTIPSQASWPLTW